MARAGMIQAEIVRENILSLIKGEHPSKAYKPQPLEGSLKLSLGLVSKFPSLFRGIEK